jgi:hypothetical protein
MKQVFHFSILLFIAMACSTTGIEVEIKNSSDGPIDSIRVYTSTKASEILFLRVDGGETQSQFLNMEKEPAVDGNYVVTYQHGSSRFFESISYFTNGAPLEKKLTIVVAANGVHLER